METNQNEMVYLDPESIMDNDSREPLSPATMQALTTEHFTLQGARSVVISEVNSRATIYLSAVSSTVVALAFVTSLSQSPELVRAFALVLLPILAFMGFVTKARLVQLSYADFQYQRAINRIRHFYVDVAPEAARYLTLSIHDDVAGVARTAGYTRGRRMGLLTAAVMIAVINYVIVGLTAVIALRWVTSLSIIVAILLGIVLGLLIAFLDYRHEEAHWRDYVDSFEVRFPSPPAES
jgi:hypothetical protein